MIVDGAEYSDGLSEGSEYDFEKEDEEMKEDISISSSEEEEDEDSESGEEKVTLKKDTEDETEKNLTEPSDSDIKGEEEEEGEGEEEEAIIPPPLFPCTRAWCMFYSSSREGMDEHFARPHRWDRYTYFLFVEVFELTSPY